MKYIIIPKAEAKTAIYNASSKNEALELLYARKEIDK